MLNPQIRTNSLWMPYTQMKLAGEPLSVAATDDIYLILEDGRRLIDGLASWWTACHGYNHPHVRATVAAQLETMPHVMFGGIQHQPARRLADRLASLLPGDLNHVFFCDSGSVAVEVAMKIAVQFWLNQGVNGRHQFVSFENAYHGDTIGAMSVCDPVNSMHAHFEGFVHEQFSQILPRTKLQLQTFDRFLARHRQKVAAVILEPLIQGAGGMKFHDAETLAQVVSICHKHDVLFIADEIATGFGRSGTMFACEQADVVPDIMCVGKALTAGTLSMAATIGTEKVFDAFLSDDPSHCLMHGPTYMANPLACSAANASLDLFEQEPRLPQVKEMEGRMEELLAPCRAFDGVVDVRVKGAVGVIQVQELYELERLRQEFVNAGVWLRPFKDMIYITPALTIGERIVPLCEAVAEVCRKWSRWQ